MRRFVAVFSTFLATLALTLSVAEPAHAAKRLGGVSVWNACVYQHGTPSYLVLRGYNVHGWRCQYNGGWNAVEYGVNLNKECARAYGKNAYANYTNYRDPYSWSCYR